jgi:hypothetical protein
MWVSYLPSGPRPGFDCNFDCNPGGSQQHAADESEPTTVSSEYARTLADGNGRGFTRHLISCFRGRRILVTGTNFQSTRTVARFLRRSGRATCRSDEPHPTTNVRRPHKHSWASRARQGLLPVGVHPLDAERFQVHIVSSWTVPAVYRRLHQLLACSASLFSAML